MDRGNAYSLDYSWEVLRPGILSYPVSLSLQCLMFIIGHLFDDILLKSVALLPRSIRYQLLLLLPSVDVCKLEWTPFTHDIPMDEIWEALYREKILSLLLVDEALGLKIMTVDDVELITPQHFSRNKGIQCSWKESYFDTLYSFRDLCDGQFYDCIQNNCYCDNDHFILDSLYGVSFSSITNLYQCFVEQATLSIHGIYRCAHSCPRLTTKQHYNKFLDTSGNSCDTMELITFINTLVDCQITLKYLVISELQLHDVSHEYLLDPQFIKNLAKLVASVEGIAIYKHSFVNKDGEEEKMKTILDLVFQENVHLIKSVIIQNQTYIDLIFLHLTKSTECSLKHLEFRVCISDFKLQESLVKLLHHHQQLEKVIFFIKSPDPQPRKIIFQCGRLFCDIADLMHRPTMKELTFDSNKSVYVYTTISVSMKLVEYFFQQFLSSPYPVSLSLHLNCTSFRELPQPLPARQGQMNKSLTLEGDLSVNLYSVFPHDLVLKSLYLNGSNLVCLFVRLKSITLDKCKINCGPSDTVLDICTFFTIVTAKEWDVSVCIEETPKTIDAFTGALSKIADRLQRFEQDYPLFDNCNHSYCSDMKFYLAILQVVLSAISSSKPPYFVLGLPIHYIDPHINDIYDTWKKCGAAKLKRIEVFDYRCRCIHDFDTDYRDTLETMALEVSYLNSKIR